jgi:antirestriction protein ArdC
LPAHYNATDSPTRESTFLQLGAAPEITGYACPIWLTLQRAKELGGHLKKGERGLPVVYANTFKRKDQAADGQETQEDIPFLKECKVFNAEQCEGLPAHFYALAEPPKEERERIQRADSFFAVTVRPLSTVAIERTTRSRPTRFGCRPSKASATPESYSPTVLH